MSFRKYGTFVGGIDLPHEKQATQAAPIRPVRTPERLRVPLSLFNRRQAIPVVREGTTVRAHQIIATSVDDSPADVFSPLAGRVAGITEVSVAAGTGGFVRCRAIELRDLSDPDPGLQAAEPADWSGIGDEELLGRIRHACVPTHRRVCEPLAWWIGRAQRKKCAILIANAMESQPYVTSSYRMLAEQGAHAIVGLAILARLIGATEVMLAAERRRIERYRNLLTPAGRYGIDLVALGYKYPTGADPILVKVLTRREVAPGCEPMDVGVAVTDIATCLAAYGAVVHLRPAVARTVTVAGPLAAKVGNFHAPFGLSCRELAGGDDGQVIHGGPMTGLRCPEDAVVSATTDAVLALDEPEPVIATPCIRCGWCTDHCPARLNVAVLNDVYELGRIDQAKRLAAEACVGCGVCSYVCPARLPLSQRVKQLKQTVLTVRRDMPLFIEPPLQQVISQ